MATRLDSITTLEKYGKQAYHVFISEEHWGNVCGYGEEGWTAIWFLSSDNYVINQIRCDIQHGGTRRGFKTRVEAVAEVRIQTMMDRNSSPWNRRNENVGG